jgi:hypothetical protein
MLLLQVLRQDVRSITPVRDALQPPVRNRTSHVDAASQHHVTRPSRSTKENAMTHARSLCALTLCAALSLAAAGCDMGSNDLAAGIAAAGSAVAAELPAQF